ncbi:hypothetical protein GJ744_002220 [Endocarpon pusillum]|uniref:Uncharacterized protein n=1 Tax=Endocarpon pusillum TaxID=364733 RepID=A0A8H7E2S2_9EURO|nr:hypothetical protein GJ744_002220 [Endocarpon pusillum]
MPTLPGSTGVHAAPSGAQTLKVNQSQGPQVVDTWAFSLSPHSPTPGSASSSSSASKPTYLSMSHTRSSNLSLRLQVGRHRRLQHPVPDAQPDRRHESRRAPSALGGL